MKLCGSMIFLLLTAFILSLAGCKTGPSGRNNNNKITPAAEAIPGDSSGWAIKEVKYYGGAGGRHNTESKSLGMLVADGNGIAYLNGSSLHNLIEFPDTGIIAMDFSRKYIAFCVFPFRKNYNTDHDLYIARIIKTGSGLKLNGLIKYPTPFSQSVTDVKFLNENTLLVTSFLEYGIVRILHSAGENIKIAFLHYPFLNFNLQERLRITSSFKDKKFLVYGGSGASLLHERSGNDYALKKLFYFDRSREYGRADENNIAKLAALDSVDGAFLCYNSLVFYHKNSGSAITRFRVEKFIHLNKTDSLNVKSIVDIKVMDDSDYICLTRTGLLLKKHISNFYDGGSSWEIIKKVPAANPSRLDVVSRDSLIAFDQSKLFLIYKKKDDLNRLSVAKANNIPFFAAERLAQPASTYGVGIGDLENNGHESVYLVDVYDKNQLYFSVPDWASNKFPDNYATQRGLEGRISAAKPGSLTFDIDLGVALGDINEDGAEDLIVTNLAYANSLYLNNGSGYFHDVTSGYNFNVNMWRSEGAVLADVNNDGYLDVFCTSFFRTNRIFINYYGVSLNERTEKYRLKSNGRSISAVFGDVNNDGFPDLYVANWMKENKLYINNGRGNFIDRTKESGVGCGIMKETNSVFFADLNNDGLLDLFVGNRDGGDRLFINKGNGRFKDVTAVSGLNGSNPTYGAVFGDFTNDGRLDIVLACLGGVKYFMNMGNDSSGVPRFSNITSEAFAPGSILGAYCTGLAVADFGHRGFLDLVLNQNGGYTYFLLNQGRFDGNNNFLSVKVEGDESNRDAVGAKLKLFYKDSLIAYREVSGGFGYASSSSKIQHFGLGNLKDSLSLAVYFPKSHITRKIQVRPNTFISVTENTGIKRTAVLARKALLRFFYGEGFLVLGIELLLLLAIFFLFITFASRLLKLRPSKIKNSKFNLPLMAVSLFVFYAVKIISVESMSFYFGPAYFILNSRNLFTDEFLPLLTSCIVTLSVLLVMKNRESGKIAGYGNLNNLLIALKRFGHGEGMLMVLHRLSLLVENYNSGSETESVYGMESLERIRSALSEYKNAVLPEIDNIHNLLIELHSGEKEIVGDLNYSQHAESIVRSSIKITESCSALLGIKSANEKLKIKEDAVHSIKKLREDLNSLRFAVHSAFAIDAAEAVDLAIKKFQEQYPYVEINFNRSGKNVSAVMAPSDFNEMLNILIINAIEEFGISGISNGRIKIDLISSDEKVILKIEDNGKGIPEEARSKLFSEGVTTKPGGHGIGLSIVKNCLAKYEGDISVSSGEMGGALFVIVLNAI